MFKSKYFTEKFAYGANVITSLGITVASIILGIFLITWAIHAGSRACDRSSFTERCSRVLKYAHYNYSEIRYMGTTSDRAKHYRNSEVYLFRVTNLRGPSGSAPDMLADVKVEFDAVGDPNRVYDALYSVE